MLVQKLLAGIAGATLAAVHLGAAQAQAEPVLVIENVRIFDGETTIASGAVLIRGGVIEAVGADIDAPEGAEIVDGAGGTLLPGLIDAHTHTWGAALADALRFGVTAELDMFTSPEFAAAQRPLRDSHDATDQADFWSAGMLATIEGGHGTQFGIPIATLTGPADAEAWVAARLAEGSDFIKIVYGPESLHGYVPSLDRETMAAVIEAAHAAGVLAVVHIGTASEAADAAQAGADGLVHVFSDALVDPALAEAMAAQGMFVTPTLSVLSGCRDNSGPTLAEDARLSLHLSPEQRSSLIQGFPFGAPDCETARENVRRLHAAGVAILAGADAPNPGTAHGVSLHGEMAMLVDAGLTPQQALAAATSAPARAFGLADRGRIAAGMRADLVLVDGDPTTDIAATRAIRTIWKNGAEIARETFDAAAVGGALDTPVLADFESGLDTGFGSPWMASTDQMAGGASIVEMTLVEGAGGVGQALHLAGEIRAGFPWPWAGAAMSFSPDWTQTHDLSSYEALVLNARGTPGTYRVMLFDNSATRRPFEQSFEAVEAWTEIRLPMSGFAGDTANITAIVVSGGPAQGVFELVIDDMRVE